MYNGFHFVTGKSIGNGENLNRISSFIKKENLLSVDGTSGFEDEWEQEVVTLMRDGEMSGTNYMLSGV